MPTCCVGQNRTQRLCFGFWLQLSPPSRIARLHHPSTSNPVYACQMGSPLVENNPPHIALAKNRAPAAWFWILAPTQPPLAHCPITPPDHLKLSVRLPNRIPPTRKRTPPHCVGQNRALVARFRNLALTWPPPLCIARSHSTTSSNPMNPTKIRSPVPEN